MNFVISITDGGGKEFYVAAEYKLIALASSSEEPPKIFKNHKAVSKAFDYLRPRFSRNVYVYGIVLSEFVTRRQLVQQEYIELNRKAKLNEDLPLE